MIATLNSLKISTRLLIAFGGAALMVAAISAIAAAQMQALAQQLGTPQALQAGRQSVWLIAVIAALASGGGAVVAVCLTRSLAQALGAEPRELAAHARRVANGDLAPADCAAPQGVMADLERMRAKLVELVAAVHDQAAAVAGASAQIARGGAEIGERSAAQAIQLRQAAGRMQTLAGAVRRNAEHAQQARAQAGEARAAADEGQTGIARVVTAMQAITDDAKRIAHIAELIDRLAGQTTVLALNAAAAAARAGSAGREFAVVAHEVRALAQRCTEAAAEVQVLITASVEQARSGDAQVRRAGGAVQHIVAAVAAVADRIDAIGHDSKAQSAEIEQLDQALSVLDARTRDSAALVSRNGAAAQALDRQASGLLQAVAAFRLPGAMLSESSQRDHDFDVLPADRRSLQPGRG
jgi:methyl-accepting chemotaxis protein